MKAKLTGSQKLMWLLRLTLLGQLSWLAFDYNYSPKLAAIEVDAVLPFALTDLDDSGRASGEALVAHRSSCFQAFACSSKCPFCGRFADTYLNEHHDVLPDALRPRWLITTDSAGAVEWALQHGVPAAYVYALGPTESSWYRGPRFGRLWFSPTRLILRDMSLVRDARPADTLLDDGELTAICLNGGSAPQSLDELIAEQTAAAAEDPTEAR